MQIRKKIKLFAAGIFVMAAVMLFAPETAEARSISDLGLDAVDRTYMVQGNDGYYYWAVLNPTARTWYEVRFRLNGSSYTDFSEVGSGTFDAWKDPYGNYVWNAQGFWDSGHDFYTQAAVIAYLNSIYGTGGHINVLIDYSGTLDAFNYSMPRMNMYIKSRNRRSVTIKNYIGDSSWADNKTVGYGALFQLDNGTYSLRTRGLVLDGADHYTYVMSTCSNCVYVADGSSYYSYDDEFVHGYTSAVISNHHSNGNTIQCGESYVSVKNSYFHDCLIGVVANNRIDLDSCTFSNCTQAACIGGTGGSAGGTCQGGINGLWNPWGSRGTIKNCTITCSQTETVRGSIAAGITIGGNWLTDSSTSVTITGCTINTAGEGIHISDLAGKRDILIEKCTIKDDWNTITNAIWHDNAKGGTTTLSENDISKHGEGIWIKNGSVIMKSGKIHSTLDNGVVNQGSFYMSGGEIYSCPQAGIYNITGNAKMTGGKLYSNNGEGVYNNASWADGDGTATFTMTGGEISGNGHGIYNKSGSKDMAGAVVSGGTIKGNTYTAVYQNGYFELYSSPSVSGNIYLCKDRYVAVPYMLNISGLKLDMPDSEKYVGRVVVRLNRTNITASGSLSKQQTIAEKFGCSFTKLKYESDKKTAFRGSGNVLVRGGLTAYGESDSTCILTAVDISVGDVNEEWTNVAQTIQATCVDYITRTALPTMSGYSITITRDDGLKVADSSTGTSSYTLKKTDEGEHTWTIKIGTAGTLTKTTRYDITPPGIDGPSTAYRVEDDDSEYAADNIISQHTDDEAYRSVNNPNKTSGLKHVIVYRVLGSVKTPIYSEYTIKTFTVSDTHSLFDILYDAETEERADYYLVVSSDFAGNISKKKIVLQKDLLTMFHTSIDRSTYE